MTDPLGLTFGKIVGRYLANVADGVDSDDMPEFEPLSGTITLTAQPPKILVPQGIPDPVTVVQLPDFYVCTLDDQGYLTNQGTRGVRVIAPTPGTTNPNNFTYRASFDLYYGTKRVPIAPFSFYVAATGDTDLTKVSPVPGSLGNAVTQGVSVVGVTLVGDALVFSLSDGSTLPPVDVPDISAAAASAEAAAESATDAEEARDAAEAALNGFDLSIGTVTTGAPGSPASATVSGGPTGWVVDLVLPQGEEGPTGPPAPNATATTAGLVKLPGGVSGEVGGSFDHPTVTGWDGKSDVGHTHTSSAITDATTVGKQVLTASNAAAARAAISTIADNDSRLTDARTPTAAGQVYDIVYVHTSSATTRATGGGNVASQGIKLTRNIRITQVRYRGTTPGASGTLDVELRKNGSQVTSTNKSIAVADQTAGGANATATGTFDYDAGDILLPWITGVGTSPGLGLIVEMTAVTR
ncbi:hypothetical protein [Nocardia cerradoensis]|uniref:Minor tail protein n=1 Tax=Nocardia cerradoensis TaxID=85688 RepID=A0A231GTH6_9NOCA|nr:hypothetical protein [Nocardia cerradoensis]NKY48031.1 hypothetical protein [Nocardia cerradoensis]OXR39892.1 hypothetical protein B7C42_08038 [Nocardia cerradoensis]